MRFQDAAREVINSAWRGPTSRTWVILPHSHCFVPCFAGAVRWTKPHGGPTMDVRPRGGEHVSIGAGAASPGQWSVLSPRLGFDHGPCDLISMLQTSYSPDPTTLHPYAQLPTWSCRLKAKLSQQRPTCPGCFSDCACSPRIPILMIITERARATR